MDSSYQSEKTAKRFVPVNGVLFRSLRMALGWSQTELARRAGYTSRLIRKAESGGSLNYETIEDLATALSTAQTKIALEQLIFDKREIVRQAIEAYDSYGVSWVEKMEHYFAEDIQLKCSADPNEAPFGGIWRGLTGISVFFERFFQTYGREQKQSMRVTYLTGAFCVTARFQDVLRYQDKELPPHQVNWYFEFEQGRIVRFDYEYDQYQARNNLAPNLERDEDA